jgi:outer membrane receptor for ferrienterochelin and colicins
VDNNHAVMGNDNLKPESSHSISFSYTNYYGKDKWKFSTTIDVFYNDISNKIDFIYYSATEAEYGNIARFQSTGGEITQTIGYKNWNCNVTYVHLLISNALEGQSGEFFSTPQLVLHPSWKHEESNTSVNLFYNFYGRMNRAFLDGSDNISIGVMQSYTLMDATVSKLFFNKKLSLTVGVRNILNWMNIENTIGGAGHGSSGGLIISPGRTFFINARYEIF